MVVIPRSPQQVDVGLLTGQIQDSAFKKDHIVKFTATILDT
jgi:hypothetical protein